MAQVDAQVIYKDLENRKLKPLYFFFGDEAYLLDQMPERFKRVALDENTTDFNFNLFYAEEANAVAIRDAVETLPVFAPQRLVIVKNADQFSDSDWSQLEPVLMSPVESTVFILLAEKVDKRKRFFKLLTDHGSVVEFKKPFENQVPGWIKYIAESHALKISTEAIHRLHRLVGNNLSEIDSQVQKLKAYLGDRTQVGLEDVNQVVSLSREENIFDFTKAIGKKDKSRALEQLVQLLDQGQSEVGIVQLVARHMRILHTIRNGMDQGLGGAKLASLAKVPAYFVDEYCEQAKHWPPKKIEESLVLLQETDKALKSSPLSSHIWLENMVLKSCNQ